MPGKAHHLESRPTVSILPRLRVIAEQLTEGSKWHETQVDALSLFLQLGLHLPRFDWEVATRDEAILTEGMRLRERLVSVRQDTSKLVPRAMNTLQLPELTFTPISDNVARPILECYHYLMSYRLGSLHFGLTFKGEEWPWVLFSLSPFDLTNITQGRQEWTESALVLSRVYAFPQAPRNAISFSLSKMRHWLALHRPETTALVTYCNPNLGFTGASYEADNWQLLGYEHCTRYAYLHGNYVTDRRIAELFGKIPDELSSAPTGQGISFSVWPLEPLRLYVRSVRGKIAFWDSEPHDFDRWMPTELGEQSG